MADSVQGNDSGSKTAPETVALSLQTHTNNRPYLTNLESQDQIVTKGFTPAAFLEFKFGLVV